jgi:hypothetical protein
VEFGPEYPYGEAAEQLRVLANILEQGRSGDQLPFWQLINLSDAPESVQEMVNEAGFFLSEKPT